MIAQLMEQLIKEYSTIKNYLEVYGGPVSF